MHISSSYAKILGETNFRTREFPQSGSKAKDGEKKKERERKEERLNDGNNNGQAMHGASKHAWHTQDAWANTTPTLFKLTHESNVILLLCILVFQGVIKEKMHS